MKYKIILVLVLFVVVLYAVSLPTDGNGRSIQVYRTIRLYDDDNDVLDHMYNGTFADTTRWNLTDSLSISGGSLVYTETDTIGTASTASIEADSLSVAIRNNQSLIFYYDVAIDSAVVGGTVIAWIDGICDSTALSLTAGTDKYVSITTGSSATDSSFVFHIQPDTLVTRADFSFDNFELRGYYESPVSISNGSDITLTVPDDTYTITIDSDGTDIKVEVGSSYYLTDTPITIPTFGHTTIKIANDSGGTASVSFYFSTL
jgi:hypothetical protein